MQQKNAPSKGMRNWWPFVGCEADPRPRRRHDAMLLVTYWIATGHGHQGEWVMDAGQVLQI
jgi:hypothetical protein